jgi:hypothetical protein
MSGDKVRIKGSCWSVGTIYDPRVLPVVSRAGQKTRNPKPEPGIPEPEIPETQILFGNFG